jgi:outer membrane phospholipase A
LFFQLSYQHESNGRAEPESRSTNYLYLKSVLVWYNERTKIGLGIAPKIWAYVGNDNKTNPDLSDYRSYFQINIRVGKADSLVLGSELSWAKEGGSIQADLTYPVHQFLGDNLEIYLHLQYVNALAESLINYQNRTEAFRIGFSIVR